MQDFDLHMVHVIEVVQSTLKYGPNYRNESNRVLFFRFSMLLLDVVPDLLREYFKERWDTRYPQMKWNDDAASGNLFWNGSPSATVPLGKLKVSKSSGRKANTSSGKVATAKDLREFVCPNDVIEFAGRRWRVIDPISSAHITVNQPPDEEGEFDAFGLEIRCERNAPSNMARPYEKEITKGMRSTWDISLLVFTLVQSSHQLLQCTATQQAGVAARCGSCPSCKTQQILGDIKTLRNKDYGHVQQCGINAEQFNKAKRTILDFVKHCLPSREAEIKEKIESITSEFIAEPR
jgi:hypothetical protein